MFIYKRSTCGDNGKNCKKYKLNKYIYITSVFYSISTGYTYFVYGKKK